MREGALVRMARGLYDCPRQSKWGPVPSKDRELIRAFLGTMDFIFPGPYFWNALGLGTTQLYARTLIYNRKRSGVFKLGTRQYEFRRIPFLAGSRLSGSSTPFPGHSSFWPGSH